jgi:hypothetical protein
MECDQCGARRPRSGPCPECGAPPPGNYSSLRQWKDQSRSGQGPAYGGGRGSGANWGGGASGVRGGRSSGAGWRADDDWQGEAKDEWEDERGRSGGRAARRAPEYEEVDLERALVPTRDEMLPMSQSAAGMPAVPGMPASDEEERILGIRRPVYIPATGDRRKRKLGTFRIVSGVVSIMLVCIVGCGLAGILEHDQISAVLSGPKTGVSTPVTFDFSKVPATPVATYTPQNKLIKTVVTATGADNNHVPIGPTSHFLMTKPNGSQSASAVVSVIVYVRGIPKGEHHTISVHWYIQDADVGLTPNADTMQQIAADSNVLFTLAYPQPGLGTARIFVDLQDNETSNPTTDPHLAATIYFAIMPPNAGTPTVPASKTASPPANTTPSPSPHASLGGGQVAWRGQPALS